MLVILISAYDDTFMETAKDLLSIYAYVVHEDSQRGGSSNFHLILQHNCTKPTNVLFPIMRIFMKIFSRPC